MCGHRLYKDLLLISLLLVSSDCSEDAAWTEELLEGEQVESMCDSFLQTSLHVAPSEQLNGQLTRKSHKKDPALDGAPGTVEELPVMAQPLSFLQADEVVETPKDEAYADSIVVDEGFQNPNVLRWGTLFFEPPLNLHDCREGRIVIQPSYLAQAPGFLHHPGTRSTKGRGEDAGVFDTSAGERHSISFRRAGGRALSFSFERLRLCILQAGKHWPSSPFSSSHLWHSTGCKRPRCTSVGRCMRPLQDVSQPARGSR
mmetsp:Transcript_103411/g.183710  ORF Transcript_103411/g.183710 Transcript_103411/m.183710 type:complete len:257 (-) Transcript_103411:537-1307(-)